MMTMSRVEADPSQGIYQLAPADRSVGQGIVQRSDASRCHAHIRDERTQTA